jgi:inorganic pyrophosphatase
MFNAMRVMGVKPTHEKIKVNKEDLDAEFPDVLKTEEDYNMKSFDIMKQTNVAIKAGAKSFLMREYTFLSIFCLIFGGVLLCAVDMPWKNDNPYPHFPYTTFCFLVGAFTSMLAGYIGMMIATSANWKVTYLCSTGNTKPADDSKVGKDNKHVNSMDRTGIDKGFNCAYNGGQVLGFVLVGMALLILEILILSFKNGIMHHIGDKAPQARIQHQVQVLFEMISGYGLGGSTVALFGRVGGGIYTKAADVGADLAGKVGCDLKEDSPENPGTIADNVGDNVGDIAGMGADLFGSLAESTCAALVVSGTSWPLVSTPNAIYFPLMVTAVGIGASFITVQFALMEMTPEWKLRVQLIVSTVLMSICIVPLLWTLPEQLDIAFAGKVYDATRQECYGCIMLGLWSGLFIGLSTEYYTSHAFTPTRTLARACLYDAATNIIKGLALGYMSCIIPIICLSITVLLAFHWAAMYGVALAALGMLGCLPVCLAIDGYGPISDNAGGIAEMSYLHEDVRDYTDELDAAGNTTAAIGKGFAIGSACLVALALFGAFITRVSETDPLAFNVNILEPFTFAGLLFGAMIPYAFSALTMSAVGEAAEEMMGEIFQQVKDVKNKVMAKCDPSRCVRISTNASLKKMIAPGAIVILSPLIFGYLFGHRFVSGMLAGTITSGIQIAFSASNTGGAWDNAKKFVEAGKLNRDDKKWGNANKENNGFVKKGDPEHKAAVCGDTVGDPLKDTSGPSINILIKLMAITSLVFGTFIAKYGGLIGGKKV